MATRLRNEEASATIPETKLPILLIGYFLSSAGRTRQVCEELTDRLAAAGWRVFTSSDKMSRVLRMLNMVGTAWLKRKQYEVAQVDVFANAAFAWAEAVCWTMRVAGKPYILTLHGGALPDFARRWPNRVRRLLSSARIVTAPSPFLAEQMKPYREDVRILPNAINIRASRFRLRTAPRPRLVWLRSFHKQYNPSMAPRVLALLARDFPDIHLIMVGPDKGDGSLQAMQRVAEELGVSERIELPGMVCKTEVPDWLDRGDIFVNTTNVDNTPVSVLEAMACGLCVVTTNVGGIPYLARHEDNALLTPSEDAQAMAEAVSRLLRDHELAERLSNNGRKEAEQVDWSVILPEWERLLFTAAGAEQQADWHASRAPHCASGT
jgi:glycosyltransferase involved in cell wall biosynthesis